MSSVLDVREANTGPTYRASKDQWEYLGLK
jgi:hypothetical protein